MNWGPSAGKSTLFGIGGWFNRSLGWPRGTGSNLPWGNTGNGFNRGNGFNWGNGFNPGWGNTGNWSNLRWGLAFNWGLGGGNWGNWVKKEDKPLKGIIFFPSSKQYLVIFGQNATYSERKNIGKIIYVMCLGSGISFLVNFKISLGS